MILSNDCALSHFLSQVSQVSQVFPKLFPSFSQDSTVSRENSTISRENSTISRPKWRENLLKMRGEHGIINSVQNAKRTGLTGRHCPEQRCCTMRSRLIIEVLCDPKGGSVDVFFTSDYDSVPNRCILDVDAYNNLYPRFNLSDIIGCFLSGSETAWLKCATYIDDPPVVEDFYDTAIVESETVAVFELESWQVTEKYFIPVDCDTRFGFLSWIRKLLQV